MKTFETAAVRIAFDDVGSGPPIVFLHNGGTSSSIWRHQVAALGRDHRAIALDLPGFGESSRPEVPLTLAELTQLVAALLDDLETGPATIVGNCMGSNIAACLAVSRPDLVRGLVLVNPLTAATFSAGWLGPLYRVDRWAHGPSAVGRRLARHIVSPKLAATATLRFQLGSKGVERGLHHDPELLACVRRADQMPALIDVLDDLDAYGGLDQQLDLSGVPVWTIWGRQNRVLSPKAGAVLDARLHPERHLVVEGCGHLPMLEDPDAVTNAIATFVAQVATAARNPNLAAAKGTAVAS